MTLFSYPITILKEEEREIIMKMNKYGRSKFIYKSSFDSIDHMQVTVLPCFSYLLFFVFIHYKLGGLS